MKPKAQNYSRARRLKNQIASVVLNPYNVIVLIAIILLAYLIVVPLIDMVSRTFVLAQRDLRAVGGTGHVAGEFTFYYWQRLLASKLTTNLLLIPLGHSLLIGFAVSAGSILLGSILAWLMVRSDLPLKPFFSLAVIIPYMIPSWVKSQAWLSMFRTPRIGGTTGFVPSILLSMGMSPDAIETLISPIAYGPLAIIIVLSLHYYAYTYLLVSAALNSINSELEEMGEIQGASKALILRRITLPLVLPAMLSAVILTFSKAIGTFGVINYLGSPVRFRTLSSELYSNSQSQNTQTAFAMAILMIIIAAISVFVNQQLIGSRKSYATIGGKGGRSTLIGLGAWKPLITALLLFFFIFAIIMPVLILMLESVMLQEGKYSLDNFTWYYWIGEGNPDIMEGLPGIFKNENFLLALKNSVMLTLVNGIFGTLFGQMLGYICAKGRGKFHGRLVEQLVFIPYLIPSIAFGGIYLSMFARPQQIFGVTLIPALYGTFTLLTLTSVVKHLPFASRAGTSNMLQISGELEEAATIEGAGFFRRFAKIVFPLSKGGFISGFMLIFVSIMKELDLIVLIMTPSTTTLPYLAFQYQNNNAPQSSDCVAIVMFSIVFLTYALANIFGDADLAKSMAG
ncbi:MAG: iron ABC transporter permease [Clostridia bacterium]|nr:iron ABC transporter permease [Clostridia bacterium]